MAGRVRQELRRSSASDGDGHAIENHNRQLGLHITELTGLPDWGGHPPDYSWAIQVLHPASAETVTDASHASP